MTAPVPGTVRDQAADTLQRYIAAYAGIPPHLMGTWAGQLAARLQDLLTEIDKQTDTAAGLASGPLPTGGAYVSPTDLPLVLHALETTSEVIAEPTAVLYRAVAIRLGSDL